MGWETGGAEAAASCAGSKSTRGRRKAGGWARRIELEKYAKGAMVVYTGPRRSWAGRVFCRKTASTRRVLFFFISLPPAACPFLLPPSLIGRPVGPRPGRPVHRSSGPRGHSCPAARLPALSAAPRTQPPRNCSHARPSPSQRPGLAGLSRPRLFTAPAMTPHRSFLSRCRLPPTSQTVEATDCARSRHRSSMRAPPSPCVRLLARLRRCSSSRWQHPRSCQTGVSLSQPRLRPCICLIPHLILHLLSPAAPPLDPEGSPPSLV